MVLICKIKVGVLTFTGITEVTTESSWRKFTDTAIIKFPRALFYLKDGEPTRITKPIHEIVKTGDLVTIQLGYNQTLVTEFEGYVSRSVKPTFPYEVECEDEMWQLKRKKVSISKPAATIREILETIAPDYEVDCPDEVFGKISLKDVTPVTVLEHLKKTAGLYTFFRGKRLVCGLVYTDTKVTETIANYAFGRNIINEDLQFLTDEDIKTIIYGTVTKTDGTVLRASVGEEGGNVIRKNYQNIYETQKQLEEVIQRTYNELRVKGGYDGDLKSFGFPFVVHGQTVRVKDDLYEVRDSNHFVDKVTTTFSRTEGYKRTLKISTTT